MARTETIHLEREAAIAWITIDRPDRFNSLDVEAARDFRRAGLQCARDDAVRVVVIRGMHGVFCSGADLKRIGASGADEELSYLQPEGAAGDRLGQAAGDRPEGGAGVAAKEDGRAAGYGERFQQILEYLHSAISEIRRAPKPFLAAVDGVAAAGGLGLAMACDLVFASERSRFEWAYGRTGLTGAESATFLLPRLVGLRRCMDLVLLNPRLDATAALRLGLVSEVVPTERFEARVREVALRLAAGPTRAYGVAKRLVNRATGMDRLERHLDEELDWLRRIADGPEFAEGLEAFLGKRPARFEGA